MKQQLVVTLATYARLQLRICAMAPMLVVLASCGDARAGSPVSTASIKAVAPVNTNGIYMSSNEPLPTSLDQETIANGFNAAVNEAAKLAFTDANYSWLYNRFNWANAGNVDCSQQGMDSGGGGYFASLSGRCAYYSRDYAHYLIGAYYMGYHSHNLNMALKFSTVLDYNDPSNPRPWWAFGINGKPYESKAVQPAIFEIGDSILTLYKMTGDQKYLGLSSYINNEVNSVYWSASDGKGNQFISTDGFRITKNPSYDAATYNEFAYNPSEANIIPAGYDIFLGGDSAASQISYFCNLASHPEFLSNPGAVSTYVDRCNTLRSNFNTNWWSGAQNVFSMAQIGLKNYVYTTQTTSSGTSKPASDLTPLYGYVEEPNFFPLYKNVIIGEQKSIKQADYVNSSAESKYVNSNNNYTPGIESFTYLPSSFFHASDGSANRYDYAWKWMRRLARTQYVNASNSSDGIAATYPEVPFVLISDAVTKIIGLDFDGIRNAFSTLPRLPSNFSVSHYISLHNVPLYSNAPNSSYNLPVDIIAQKVDSTNSYAIQLAFNGLKPWQITTSSASLTWTPKFSMAVVATGCAIQTTYDDGTVSQKTYAVSNAPGYYTCIDSSGKVVTVNIPIGSAASTHVSKIIAMTYYNASATSILKTGLPAYQ
ncbi:MULTISPECIES: hypothetical protein [Burkholderia]|nr:MULTISPECIES: hypothetical protein [unclassified Burkholderia]